MILIISVIATIAVSVFFAKRIFKRKLQSEYEKCLLEGDRKKSDRLGKMYYLSLDEATRKAKGIVDIEAKISDDFRAFNSQRFSLIF